MANVSTTTISGTGNQAAITLNSRAGYHAMLFGTFGGTTVTAEISSDGITFVALKDKINTAYSLAAAGYFQFTVPQGYKLRFVATGGAGISITAVVDELYLTA